MQLSRRDFIIRLLGLSGAVLVPSLATAQDKPAARHLLLGAGNALHIVDYEQQRLRKRVEIGFSPHAIIPHPVEKNIVWVIQRNFLKNAGGLSDDFYAAEVDIYKGRVIRRIKAPEGSDFRGHGFFSPAGENILFIARMDFNDGHSYLSGYDTRTLTQVADYRVCKGGCHETKVGADGNVYVAVWGMTQSSRHARWGQIKHDQVYSGGKREPSRIVRLDIESGNQIASVAINDENRMLTHFEVLRDGTLIASSVALAFKDHNFPTKVPAGIFFGKMDSAWLKPVEYTLEDSQPSETFGIAVNADSGFAAIGDYVNKTIISVDTASGEYLGQMGFAVKDIMYDAPSGSFVVAEKNIRRLDASLHAKATNEGLNLITGPYTEGHMIIV